MLLPEIAMPRCASGFHANTVKGYVAKGLITQREAGAYDSCRTRKHRLGFNARSATVVAAARDYLVACAPLKRAEGDSRKKARTGDKQLVKGPNYLYGNDGSSFGCCFPSCLQTATEKCVVCHFAVCRDEEHRDGTMCRMCSIYNQS